MSSSFGQALSKLRRESDLNQRQLAGELKISQALLSHYENGAREPGLDFVRRVCDYFGVTADFVLGREAAAQSGSAGSGTARPFDSALAEIKDPALRMMAEIYTAAAMRKVMAHIKNPGAPLEAAVAANEMSETEVRLLQTIADSKN